MNVRPDGSPCRGMQRNRTGSVDDTPTTRARDPQFRQKFKATAMWNDIVTCFVEEGPRKRHRRQFTYVDNSFTGKEAVDFIMNAIPTRVLNGVTTSRENCTKLLQKFMEKDIFHSYSSAKSGEKEVFRDSNALYVFTSELMGAAPKTPRLISDGNASQCQKKLARRSSSMRLKAIRGEGDVNDKDVSPLGFRYNVNTSPSWGAHVIPDDPPSYGGWNRRTSMSHGNLSTIVSTNADVNPISKEWHQNYPNRANCTPTCDRTRIGDENQDIDNNENEGPSTLSENSESISAYEWISFGKRKKKKYFPHTPKTREQPSGSSVMRDVNGRDITFAKTPTVIGNGHNTVPAGNRHPQIVDCGFQSVKLNSRMVTDIENWEIWRNCLLARLRTVAKVDDLSFVDWDINGYDVKWNCEKVGTSGVVKSRSDSNDFSGYLVRAMRYLEQFPFPSGSSNVMAYKDNQEINVFKTVCSNLSRDSALLTATESAALLYIVSTFYDKADMNVARIPTSPCNLPPNTHIETEFGATKSPPFTRIVQRRSTVSSSPSLYSPLSDISEPPLAIRSNGLDGTQFAFAALSDDSLCYDDALSPESKYASRSKSGSKLKSSRRRSDRLLDPRLHMEDALALPGLKQSPELMSQLSAVCITPRCAVSTNNLYTEPLRHSATTSGTASYVTARCKPSPRLKRSDTDAMLSCISLILLSLPSPRRRRLHQLIRFMNKISNNHCLQLDRLHENRNIILENLTKCIVAGDGALSPVQSVHLVALLMDNESRLFAVDSRLRSDVVIAMNDRMRDRVFSTEEVRLNDAPTPPTNVIQFCQKIEPVNYDDQKCELDDHLLRLLDQYTSDPRMKDSERDRKIKEFKKMYPHLYNRRFPVDDPRKDKENQGFFRKLFHRQ